MVYDKKAVRTFIRNYKHNGNHSLEEEQDNIDDFFSLDHHSTEKLEDSSIEDNMFFNELESVIDAIGTDKEFYIFEMLAEGKSYNEIGQIMDVTGSRIRQIYSKLLDKLP